MVLIGGPDDDVITPWQSAHFGFFDANLTVVPMRDRRIYQEDAIGLRTLDETGKLKLVTVPHVKHIDWHLNRTLIEQVVVPHLDWNLPKFCDATAEPRAPQGYVS